MTSLIEAGSPDLGVAEPAGPVRRPEAVVTSPAPRAAWDACHDADPDALPTQSAAWLDAMEATGRWADASRHYRFDDGREAVLPLVRRRGLMSWTGRASGPDAWGFGGPVGTELDLPAMSAVVADLARLRGLRVQVRPNPLHAQQWNAALDAAAPQAIRVAKRSHVLELEDDPDRLFATRFTSSARRNVRIAERSGIEVEVDTAGRFAPIFHDLLMRSVDRWAGVAREPLALARFRAGRRDPLDKFAAWADAMGDGCRILVARRDDVAIASIIVLQDGNAHLTRSAMDRDLVRKDYPNELLAWHAIRDACLAGCQWFHLGESGTSASLSAYKEKYGAVGLDYPEVRFERLPLTAMDRAVRTAGKRLLGVRSP